MSIIMVLAAYGTICKELNIPFRFPGSGKAYNCLLEVCDVEIVAKTLVWAATTKECANQAFNISNGDIFRWCHVWPKIAEFFDLTVPNPPYQELDLVEMMSDKAELWDKIVKRNGLQQIPYEKFVSWKFGNWVFGRKHDYFSDVNKARRLGFKDMNKDSGEMFIKILTSLREHNLIP